MKEIINKKIVIIGVLILLILFWYFSKIIEGKKFDIEEMLDITPSQEVINNIEELDNNFQNGSGELEKVEEEEVLNEEELKKIEEDKIKENNISLINEVGKNGDIESCNNIIDEDYKNKCINNGYAAKAGESKSNEDCLKITDISFQNRCLDDISYNKAIGYSDSSLCLKVKDENLKNNCFNTIILPIVEDSSYKGTTQICNSLVGDQKTYCINVINNKTDNSNFSIAVQSNNIVYCNNLKNLELKNTCSDTINSKIAIETKDILICNLIINSDKKNSCLAALGKSQDKEYIKQAIVDNNIELCYSIVDKETYDECTDYINIKNAIILKNELLCGEIVNKAMKKQCNDYFETLESN